MRLEANSRGYVEVVISKRNLLSLLHKVDTDWSACAIDKLEKRHDEPSPIESPFTKLVLRVEPDDVHYAHESRVIPGLAGPMHPETEDFIARVRSECGASDPGGICHLPFAHTGNCLMRTK